MKELFQNLDFTKFKDMDKSLLKNIDFSQLRNIEMKQLGKEFKKVKEGKGSPENIIETLSVLFPQNPAVVAQLLNLNMEPQDLQESKPKTVIEKAKKQPKPSIPSVISKNMNTKSTTPESKRMFANGEGSRFSPVQSEQVNDAINTLRTRIQAAKESGNKREEIQAAVSEMMKNLGLTR